MALTLFRVLIFLLNLWPALCSQNGVSLRFMGQELINGTSRVCLRDIGEQPSQSLLSPDTAEGPALVCATTNPDCCRAGDGAPGGVGDWTLNGVLAEGTHLTPLPLIYRNRGTGIVRLNAQTGAVVTGQFCCTIPDNANITRTLCVDVTLDESVCNPVPSTTSGPVTTNPPPHTSTQSVLTQTLDTTLPPATNTTSVGSYSNVTRTVTGSAPTSMVDSTITTIALGAVVGVCVGVILLLLSLLIMLYYKLVRQSRASTVEVTDTALPLRDNQAYGKTEQDIESSITQGQQSNDVVYECIPDPSPSLTHSHSGSSSEHYYY